MHSISLAHLDASAILALPDAALLPLLKMAHRTQLVRVYRLGLVCRCSWFPKLGYGLFGAECDDDGVPVGRFVPCPHMDAKTLSDDASFIVLSRLWPKSYKPRPHGAPSNAVTRDDCLQLRIARAERGLPLFNPLDARRSNTIGLDDGQGIEVERRRNGSVQDNGVVEVREKNKEEVTWRGNFVKREVADADYIDEIGPVCRQTSRVDTAEQIEGRKQEGINTKGQSGGGPESP